MSALLDPRQIELAVRRMAVEIVEKQPGLDGVMLVGIRTRGVPLAEAIAREIQSAEGVELPIGVLDITLYRDDLSTIGPQPIVKDTRLPSSIDGRVLVLCDDVLYTGRTIRAALDALADYGRPAAVHLAVLVDRVGQRQLPIQADVVGTEVTTTPDQTVRVRFESVDGEDLVEVVDR